MNDQHWTTAPPPGEPAYRLQLVVDGDTLRAQVSGEMDAQPVRLGYMGEIVAAAQARHCRKILVLDRKKGRPATPEELGELALIFRESAGKFERIAVVEPTAEFLSAVQHGEILARSQNINLRVFPDVVSAERWLLFGSADD